MKEMEIKNILKKGLCILVVLSFVLPINGIHAAGNEDKPKPDLLVEIVGYTPTDSTKNIATIDVLIINNGSTDATNFDVLLCWHNPNNVIHNEKIRLLEAGTCTNISFDWKIVPDAQGLLAIVDSGEAVTEMNDYNNIDHMGFPRDYSNEEQEPGLLATYPSAWREGESWDRSWDSNSGNNWQIDNDPDSSNGQDTAQLDYQGPHDYAEWDFTVYEEYTYYFWVRGYHYFYGCDDVRLFWDGSQIGSSESWYQFSGQEYIWTCFGSKYLSTGSGTLKIEGFQDDLGKCYLMWTDNIFITADPNYTPTGKGVEGSTSHEIGNGAPGVPSQPSGPTSGYVGTSYTYATSTTDPNSDQVKYGWDWNGDYTVDEWTGYYSSGSTCSTPHAWSSTGTYDVRVKAKDDRGAESSWSSSLAVTISQNQAPNDPSQPSGPTSGYTGTSYGYTTVTTDPDGDQVKYGWDWDGDYTVDEWTGYIASGQPYGVTHTWNSAGTYDVRVKAKDTNGAESGWSSSLTVDIQSSGGGTIIGETGSI